MKKKNTEESMENVWKFSAHNKAVDSCLIVLYLLKNEVTQIELI